MASLGPSKKIQTPRRSHYRAYGYKRLSAAYRDGLRHEGIGQAEYVQGYDLKHPVPLTKGRREAALERISTGRERPEDLGLARRWYQSRYAPKALKGQPGLNKVATAATLAQVSNWDDVRGVVFHPGGDVWTATVITKKDGSTQTISVPEYVVKDMRAWLSQSGVENEVGGTDLMIAMESDDEGEFADASNPLERTGNVGDAMQGDF